MLFMIVLLFTIGEVVPNCNVAFIIAFSIMLPTSVCSFQPVLDGVNTISPPLK